jgi:SNF2 family DNA or RNA helicase
MRAKGEWITTSPALVVPLIEYCDDAARASVEKWVNARNGKVAASKAAAVEGIFPAPPGNEYRNYQKAGVAFMHGRFSCLNADVPRLGKTIMTLGVVNKYDKPLRVLVVCPAVAKPVWQEEAEKWLIHNDGVAYAEGNTFPNTSFVIINYDILVRHIDTIRKAEWDVIVADEAHYLKNPKSGRSEAFFSIPYPKRHYIFLTGTPILRTPVDLWPLIKVLDPQKLGSNFWRYVERYCGASKENKWDTTGAANTEELQYRMRRDFMIRREKKDVGSELPPFSQCVLLPSSGLLEKLPEEEEYKDTDEANNRIRALIEDIMGSSDSVAAKTARLDDAYGEITHDTAGTREQLARRKVPMVVDFCKDLLNSEDKIVVFAFHRRAVESIAEGLSAYKPITIYGGQTTQKRWEAIQQFKKDPATRVAVVNIRSGGTAISLKEADIAVFAEITTPGEVIQARDRVWDLTKDVSVGYYYLVVDNSPEVGTWELFKARQTIVDKATNHEHVVI